jgi:hypothetical protein
MAEEKHDSGFKVVDRRSFASESAPDKAASDKPSPPAQTSSPEPQLEPREVAQADPRRDAGPRIEIPGGDEGFDVDGSVEAPSGFETLVSYLGTTAMFQLGLMTGPAGERIPADLHNARQTIAMLEVVEEKTRGNLTADESRLLDDILYELRMAFIEVEKRVKAK